MFSMHVADMNQWLISYSMVLYYTIIFWDAPPVKVASEGLYPISSLKMNQKKHPKGSYFSRTGGQSQIASIFLDIFR